MANIIQIVTTMNDKEAAYAMGRRLVEDRLAACCQVTGPVRSIYRWKGAIEETEEWYCVLKTRPSLYRRVEEAILKLHPYEVPEIIAIAIDEALDAYAGWVEEGTSR